MKSNSKIDYNKVAAGSLKTNEKNLKERGEDNESVD